MSSTPSRAGAGVGVQEPGLAAPRSAGAQGWSEGHSRTCGGGGWSLGQLLPGQPVVSCSGLGLRPVCPVHAWLVSRRTPRLRPHPRCGPRPTASPEPGRLGRPLWDSPRRERDSPPGANASTRIHHVSSLRFLRVWPQAAPTGRPAIRRHPEWTAGGCGGLGLPPFRTSRPSPRCPARGSRLTTWGRSDPALPRSADPVNVFAPVTPTPVQGHRRGHGRDEGREPGAARSHRQGQLCALARPGP